jgi:hypothetical protein
MPGGAMANDADWFKKHMRLRGRHVEPDHKNYQFMTAL